MIQNNTSTWIYSSCILAASLAASWLYLAVFWLYPSYILAVSWLNPSCILAESWLYPDCTLTVS